MSSSQPSALLRERGIGLSASQVHRLVSGTPERLSLQVLSGLCDILSCTPAGPYPARAVSRPYATDEQYERW